LVIATHGRGFYVLDDIVPLRALAANAAAGLRLFPLQTAVRVKRPQFTGTPMPKDEPLAPDRLEGAVIDYSLPAGVAGPVELTVTDASGALINRFSSNDPVKPLDLAHLPVAPEWAGTPPPPAATPGHHRFVWDLHYAKPAGLSDGHSIPGTWAAPGNYFVELSAGGQKLKQLLTVVPDPRVPMAAGDFAQQFQLARAIEAQRVRVRTMLDQATSLKAALGKISAQPNAAALSAQLAAQVGTDAPIGGSTAPNTLTSISEWLDKLAAAVEAGDAAPSPDDLHGFAVVSGALDDAQSRWNTFAAQARQATGQP
jgi:hypothetical protein